MSQFEIYYRLPESTEHLKLNEALDILFNEIKHLSQKVDDLSREVRHLSLLNNK